jgi:ketopantoate reductase
MRIAVVGAGVVGGYFGGELAHAGEDVVLLARGASLHAIQAYGLQVERPNAPHLLRTMCGRSRNRLEMRLSSSGAAFHAHTGCCA